MSYTVTAVNAEDVTGSFVRETATEAVATAVQVITKGMKDVCITDAQGRQYIPGDFTKLLASSRKKM